MNDQKIYLVNNNISHKRQFIILILLLFQISNVSTERVEILMSNVTTQKEDAYICTSYKLADDQQFITNIEPLTTADIAHHMFAFGCEKPASAQNSWNCENLVCTGTKTILFAWGRNAPELKLPDDVAYKVGPKTNFKYIVVNIHYLVKVNNDKSGLALTLANTPRRYQAGIMLMVANYINIPPNTKKYSTPFSCKYEGKRVQVFASRVHAHVHGDVNTAYRVRDNEWLQIFKGDPQWPQAFYPLQSNQQQQQQIIDLKDQDALIGVCTYHNDENRNVYAGGTHMDEMCNIYLMYYADTTDNVMEVCSGSTYPQLEKIIPDDAFIKPPLNKNNEVEKQESKNANSHHDMEGTKLHHDIQSQSLSSNKKLDKSLSDFLSNLGVVNGGGNGGIQEVGVASADYYDDVEQSRSKNRNFNLDQQQIDLTDDINSYDPNTLLDSAGIDDYGDSSSILAAELAKLTKKNKGVGDSGNNKNKNPFMDKIKNKLSKLMPQTISISKYTNLANWYDSSKVNLGQIGGIEVNQKTNTLVIFHRGSQIWQADSFNDEYRFNTRKYTTIPTDTLIILDRNTGKVLSSWGSNQFLMPHGLSLDSDDNIWVTDVGRHQVLKIDSKTHEILLEVGERLVPGSDKTHFCQPADVAVLKSGEFFVADGYCNSRIVKFSKQGIFLSEWSSEDEQMPSHFFVPHSLALSESNNLLCVADRENFRVQCFDLNGNFLQQSLVNNVGPVYAVAFAASNASILYALNGFNSRSDTQFDKKVFLISTKDGKVQGQLDLVPDIRTPHDLALTNDATEIYIANLNPPVVFKYALVNFNFNKVINDKKSGTNSKSTGSGNKNEENSKTFRMSFFMFAFLATPVILIVIFATLVRLKNMGKLKRLKTLNAVAVGISGGGGDGEGIGGGRIGRWISQKKNAKNGFTRLNQESENEETESLNRKNSSSSIHQNNSDYESDESTTNNNNLPKLAKA